VKTLMMIQGVGSCQLLEMKKPLQKLVKWWLKTDKCP
jgi:hypothetical protein